LNQKHFWSNVTFAIVEHEMKRIEATGVSAPPPIHLGLASEKSHGQEQLKVQALSKIAIAPAGTPRKGKRMANVHEAILRLLKVTTYAAEGLCHTRVSGAPRPGREIITM
jgi:hypothetical protein